MNGDLAQLLDHASATIISPWTPEGLKYLAIHAAGQLSRNDWLLAGDARLLQLRWFIEGMIPSDINPRDEVHAAAQLYKAGLETVTRLFPVLGKAERYDLAARISHLARQLIKRETSNRDPIPLATRRRLLLMVGEPPKCYLCGARFTEREVAHFLKESNTEPIADVYVDFLFPRGAQGKDRRIAVEHVRPLSDGGTSEVQNLQIACQFCNTLKSDALTVYARGHYGRAFQHPTIGLIHPPNPFWVVRILALDGKCYECGITSAEAPLRVAPDMQRVIPRYINPLGLRVACEEHDPISEEHRYVNKAVLGGQGLAHFT